MIAFIRAVIRVMLLILSLILPLIQVCLMWLPRRGPFYAIPQLWCRVVTRIMGIKIVTHGTLVTETPALFIANHASYLDIPVLQTVVPGSYIAKSEISGWPLFGWLADLQGTIFVKRVKTEAKNQANVMSQRLKAGGTLILFAEGTTSDGCRLLPLKSSLLTVAQDARVVQPVTIGFTALDGLPVGRTHRYIYAWIGDESLVPHLMRLLMQGEVTVDITFHAPIYDSLTNRKILSNQLDTVMRDGLNKTLTQAA